MPTRPPTHRPHGHRSERERKRDWDERRQRRGGTRLYQTPRWRKRRKDYLRRHPLCVHCVERGRTVAATEVDHIVPIADGGAVWDETNWQALCKSCHSAKTMRELNARRR